jgi:RNA recognition motif-containing protein
MKFFKIGGKPCRALQFDKQLLGSNKEKLAGSNVFVRSIPKDLEHEDLQKKFAAMGKIKSLKVSLNSDHSSRGYGFICFDNEEIATRAIEQSSKDDDTVAMKFEPKDRRTFRKLINNVYVKNIPMEYPEDQIKEMFKQFGEIKSLHLMKNQIGQIAFVCYDDPKGINKEYGPECAQKAIDQLNGKELEGAAVGQKLYVRHAMKKSDREIEKKKETLRYKTSKKRCNLYVKNFPVPWDKEKLESVFSQFGEISSPKDRCFPPQRSYQPPTHDSNSSTIVGHHATKPSHERPLQQPREKHDGRKTTKQKTTRSIPIRPKRIRSTKRPRRTTKRYARYASRTTNAKHDRWYAKTRRRPNATRRYDATTTWSPNGSTNATTRTSRSRPNQPNRSSVPTSCHEDQRLDLRKEPLPQGESRRSHLPIHQEPRRKRESAKDHRYVDRAPS